jgi:hypothetical protein
MSRDAKFVVRVNGHFNTGSAAITIKEGLNLATNLTSYIFETC